MIKNKQNDITSFDTGMTTLIPMLLKEHVKRDPMAKFVMIEDTAEAFAGAVATQKEWIE